MTKKLNISAISNELEGSAFFPSKKALDSPTPSPVVETPTMPTIITQQQQLKPDIPERPKARTDQRPNGKRIITRNSFEIFEDQMDSLRKLSFQEKMDGKLGSMSAMVREAIDNYLHKRTTPK